MEKIRVTNFTNPQEFLDAVKSHDDSFMNFAIGSLLDSLDEASARARMLTTNHRTLICVHKGKKLLVTFTKIADGSPWVISTPGSVGEHLSSADVEDSISLLASFLPTVLDPKLMDHVIGPDNLVDAFIETWVSHMNTQGFSSKALDPIFRMKVSFATLATLPPPSPAFSNFIIRQAHTPEEADVVAPLAVDLASHGPNITTLEGAKRTLRVAIVMKQLWLCRVDGEIAGYCLIGRNTPRTIAVRNVYVSPTHRRKGIAEAMVRAVTRYYLGAKPLGFEGASSTCPHGGVKEEVSLNVAKEEVTRLYQRCGFLLSEGAREPSTGKKGWYHSVLRGVEYSEH
ncbi:hypothetical protein PHLCEN_2v7840 [Hermanssonia centrifuga]|uniref:N-acetyltransferase domain-containing protein n=1 Tax=Hermanssonia centrifuga TaxID=98765 RepID=A0A2R6NVQ4_9APHY|nr:hypothetical protein PHLCEN_2v7840 [Hermanssonia centrifuga]